MALLAIALSQHEDVWVESGTGKVKHTRHILLLQYDETLINDKTSTYLEGAVGITPGPFVFQFHYKWCWGLLMVYSAPDRGPNYDLADLTDSLFYSGRISAADKAYILLPLKDGDYHSASERLNKALPP